MSSAGAGVPQQAWFSDKGEGAVRVIIVGGGTAGWMTAAALSQVLPPRTAEVQLVESAEIGTVGVGEATVPHIRFFNARLGFDEAQFMRETRATFKLGIEFRNWGRVGDSYIHPFGAFGRELGGAMFHHHWLRAQAAGLGAGLEAYSLPIGAARQDRFAAPATDPASPLSTFSYAFQFDAGLYAAFLRRYAEARGVRRHEGRIVEVRRHPETGFVTHVQLAGGEMLEGDLFVDCSGFRGLLIDQTLGVEFESWAHWLPCDRAWAVPCALSGPLTPYTRATAHEAGWFWRIPLQHRVGNGHVYCSQFSSDGAAQAALLAQLEAPPRQEARLLRFRAGRRRQQWSGNVVAIGLASGFLEPLESTSIHLIQLAIGYLIELFPEQGFEPAGRDEFNRIMLLEYERIRDFLILHYHATEREDTPFWNYCRTMSIPDSLADRLELFRARGLVPQYREGMFMDASWLAVLLGQRVMPRRHDPAADRLALPELAERLAAISGEYAAAIATMPHHAAYLRSIGATTELAA
jgi:tryptophan halogenase